MFRSHQGGQLVISSVSSVSPDEDTGTNSVYCLGIEHWREESSF